MKILQVISSWKGGAIRVAFDVARELTRRGNEVTIYATDLRSKNSDLNNKAIDGVVDFHTLCPQIAKRTRIYISPQLISRAIEVKHFDIIHLHGYRTFYNCVVHWFAKKYGVPYLLQAHGSLPKSMQKKRLKLIYDILFGYRLLGDASKVIALSRLEAEQYRGMGVPEEKIEVIPNGIDLSEYSDLPPQGSFKKRFGIDDDKKIVLYLGRIHRIKGVDILVKAFASAVEKLEDVRLVVVGPDDGYLNELEALIRTLEIENDVLILGPLYGRDKLEAYVDADAYVLPSRYEVWGMTVLEAVACRTPSLLSLNCGLATFIDNNVGVTFQPNQEALKDSLTKILTSPEQLEMFSANCRQVIKKFDIRTITARIEEIYKQVT